MNIVTGRPMKRWMRILASLVLFWTLQSHASCRFNASVSKVYSLSGPATQLFHDWDLLSSSKLKGATVFYPLPDDFQGERIPGGVFLSPAKLSEMKDSLVFFDESQELRKLFRTRNITAVEIKSRNQTPGEVTNSVLGLVGKYVTDCDPEKVRQRVRILEEKIIKKMKTKQTIVFFLGEVRKGRLPELVIANDGLVLWLRKLNLISSYPSELGYVNWSGSIIEDLRTKALFVGLKEGSSPGVSGGKSRATLTYPGCLIPGVGQLEAWNYFLDHQPR